MAGPKFVNPCDRDQCRWIGAFAEQEIYLPAGSRDGWRRLNLDHQPWTRHWCNMMGNSSYQRFVLMHHGQSGGTLFGFILPLMYHLFELKENVAVAVPLIEMAWPKFVEVILPQVYASRYVTEDQPFERDSFDVRLSHASVEFKNGATLSFISPGHRWHPRARISWQALFITELDGFDAPMDGGPDQIRQLELRNRCQDSTKVRTYIEGRWCPDSNRIWNEWQAGTGSVLALHCPECVRLSVVTSGHLRGWQSAASGLEAMRRAAFVCPGCSKSWTEEERYFANLESAVISRGQQIVHDRTIIGDPEETRTASLHVSIANNLLLSAETMGYHEWMCRAKTEAAVVR